MADLQEYLFLDEPRIHLYFDQLSKGQSRLHAEKVSSWAFSAKIPAIGAEGKEAVQFREPTLLEQLEIVEHHLEKHYDLDKQKAVFDSTNLFRRYRLRARRAVIPLPQGTDIGLSRLAVWVPDDNEVTTTRLATYLFEALGEDDPGTLHWITAYSAIEFMLSSVERLRAPLIAQIDASVGLDALPQVRSEFIDDPIAGLRKLGAQIFPPRYIISLFLIRLGFRDWHRYPNSEKPATGLIGYPVYIAGA